MTLRNFFNQTGYWALQRLFFYSKPKFIRKQKTQYRSVIYKPDAIGDFLLASGVISYLMNKFPEKWTLFCSPEVKPLACFIFPELECIVLPGSNQHTSKAFWRKLRPIYNFRKSRQVGKLICLKHSLTGVDHIALNWLDAETSSGTVHTPIPSPTPASIAPYHFTHTLPYVRHRKKYPLEIQAHLDVSNVFCENPIPELEARPYLPVETTESRNEPVLIIFPATRSVLRNYPPERLASAVHNFLLTHPSFKIHISGTRDQEQELLQFRKLLTPAHPSEIIFPNSIIEASQQIGKATIVVGMESAPAHIATILNKRTLSILGGGHFNHFAPWGDPQRQIWLHHPLPCYHCNWVCKFKEPLCITSISSDLILEKLHFLAALPVD